MTERTPVWAEITVEGMARYEGDDLADLADGQATAAAIRDAIDERYYDAGTFIADTYLPIETAYLVVRFNDGTSESEELFVPPAVRAMRNFDWHAGHPDANCAQAFTSSCDVPAVGDVIHGNVTVLAVEEVAAPGTPDGVMWCAIGRREKVT